jgi:vancomycin aglycone glucosyltransferase
MKVLLSSIGSRGDVQPILALARELCVRGHTARLCVAPNFREWVEGFGIECVPIGPDLKQFTVINAGAWPSPEQMQALAEQSIRDQFRVLQDAARGCDVIVAAGALQIATRSVAELLNIPYVFVAYAPVAFPSADLAPARTIPRQTVSSTEADNRALWKAEAHSWNARFLTTLNEERAKLGLAAVDDVMRHIFTDEPWLATDAAVGPAPPNSELHIVQTGAWFMPDTAPLPTSLRHFIDQGEPPIYFGFGSMRGADQAARTLIEAARALGRRSILSQGWSNLAPIDADMDCISIGDINHAELFKRVAIVVHHGGAGTTQAAARAGCAQVIIAHSYDQFYWAQRVHESGIGIQGPARDRLTTDGLIESLCTALQSDATRQAQLLASQIEQHGVQIAAQRLTDLFD